MDKKKIPILGWNRSKRNACSCPLHIAPPLLFLYSVLYILMPLLCLRWANDALLLSSLSAFSFQQRNGQACYFFDLCNDAMRNCSQYRRLAARPAIRRGGRTVRRHPLDRKCNNGAERLQLLPSILVNPLGNMYFSSAFSDVAWCHTPMRSWMVLGTTGWNCRDTKQSSSSARTSSSLTHPQSSLSRPTSYSRWTLDPDGAHYLLRFATATITFTFYALYCYIKFLILHLFI